MKKQNIILAAITLSAFASCQVHPGRHVVISQNHDLKIEYYGRARFSADSSSVASISDRGSVAYTKGDQSFTAKEVNGKVVYEFDLDGRKFYGLNAETRPFLKSAVKEMIHTGHNDD